LGNTQAISVYWVYPGWGSRRVTRCLADPDAIADTKALAADIEPWEADCEEHANALAEKHGLKVKEVRRRMLSSTTFKPRRKVSTYNAKISRIMTDLNEGKRLVWTAVGLN
jgi:hypothetical protein